MGEPEAARSVSAVIITLCRPVFVRQCLTNLRAQTAALHQIIVVDASPDDETYRIVTDEFPGVEYLRNPAGPGTMATSRNMALPLATGDIVAFLDDDAYADPDWSIEIAKPYADQSVGAVGGRALNGQPGEETDGVDAIGRFLPNGLLTGNFAANPGRVIEVDHILGANMSYRRAVLEEIGGIRDFYPGTCVREDTDPAFRVRLAGYKVLFTPFAIVRHVAAPYVKGQRFDLRYNYYDKRNHVVLLSRTIGKRAPQYGAYRRTVVKQSLAGYGRAIKAIVAAPDRGVRAAGRTAAGEALRASYGAAGLVVGLQQESKPAAWLRSKSAP